VRTPITLVSYIRYIVHGYRLQNRFNRRMTSKHGTAATANQSINLDFYARQHNYAIARIGYRPSVRLSVTRVDQSKTVEVRIMQLSPPGSPMTVSSRLTSPRNSQGNIGSEGAR